MHFWIIPLIDLAEKLNCSSQTINYRIKNLIKSDVIQAFRVNIDYSKLGYRFFKVNIDLNDYNERGRIINYVRYNPHLIMIDKSIGYHDLELNFWVDNLTQFHDIMDDIAIKFPGSVKKIPAQLDTFPASWWVFPASERCYKEEILRAIYYTGTGIFTKA